MIEQRVSIADFMPGRFGYPRALGKGRATLVNLNLRTAKKSTIVLLWH